MNKDEKEYQIMLKLAEKANACEDALEELKGYSTFKEAIEKSSDIAYYCYWYAKEVIKGRWPEGEKVILISPAYCYWYAKEVIKGRWPEGEKAILTNPAYSFLYARYVIKGRWPEGEKAIKKDTYFWETYQEFLESM